MLEGDPSAWRLGMKVVGVGEDDDRMFPTVEVGNIRGRSKRRRYGTIAVRLRKVVLAVELLPHPEPLSEERDLLSAPRATATRKREGS